MPEAAVTLLFSAESPKTPEDVAERIRIVLKHVRPEKLYLTCDCGFSASSRGLARAKLNALVAGAEIVRKELQGS